MPGRSFRGELPPISDVQRALAEELKRDVLGLGGERNFRTPAALARAVDFLQVSLLKAGYERVQHESFTIDGERFSNLSVERPGTSKEIVLIGAHYDSVAGCPGANDNGSGTAALLALARSFAGTSTSKTLRFVAFVNEEPPFFQTAEMGSLVCARACKARGESIAAMLSLETIGCYSDVEGSQKYPSPLSLCYPTIGNFIAFVGNLGSAGLTRRVVRSFRKHARFPSEGAVLPAFLPGVGWSDHWSFWQAGYPAVMVTDTAPFRYPHYHTPEDTPDKLDYERFARVVDGLRSVIADLLTF
jgi:Zn-dependent M28 family amino/carboxypeptidase